MNPTTWRTADIHFHELHFLGDRVGKKIQHHAEAQVEGAWLHIRQNKDDEQPVTVPAAVVQRIEWQ